MDFKHTDITELVIKAFYRVYNALGYGFLEKVYSNALVIELRRLGLEVVQEARITVYYDGEVVGEYSADLLVADKVIVELKAAKKLAKEQSAVAQLPKGDALRSRSVAKLWPHTRGKAQGVR